MSQAQRNSIDGYIGGVPETGRKLLNKLRKVIRAAAPRAKETIKYGIPTFELDGKNLVHFGAFRNHIGFYPTPSAIAKFKSELAPYACAKGSVRFPFGKPIPFNLIKRIVRYRAGLCAKNE